MLEIEGYKTQHRGGNHQDRGERIGGLLFLEQTSSEFFFGPTTSWELKTCSGKSLLEPKYFPTNASGFECPKKWSFLGSWIQNFQHREHFVTNMQLTHVTWKGIRCLQSFGEVLLAKISED